MATIPKRPNLSAQAYWGFDDTKLDDEKFDDYMIVRVFERGTNKDISELFDFYGPRVKKVMLDTRDLPQRAIKVAEAIWPNFDELKQIEAKRRSHTRAMKRGMQGFVVKHVTVKGTGITKIEASGTGRSLRTAVHGKAITHKRGH